MLSSERVHQPVKHQMRSLTHVPAIFKLPEILREMLPANVNVGAVDRPLEHRPVALNRIYASAVGTGVFVMTVVHRDVAETMLADAAIAVGFVGIDRGAGAHVPELSRAAPYGWRS